MLPGRTRSPTAAAQPPRCPAAAKRAPAAAGDVKVPGAGAPEPRGWGERAVPALAPARPPPAGAATGPSAGAPTARPLRGTAPRSQAG